MREIVVSEVSITHPNLLVHDAIFMYCQTIQYLLKAPFSDQNRAHTAFDMAFQFSTSCESYYNLNGQKGLPHWLDTSSAIAKQTSAAKVLLLSAIPT